MSKNFIPRPLEGKWATRCPKLSKVGFHVWTEYQLEHLESFTDVLSEHSYEDLCESIWVAIQDVEVQHLLENYSDVVVLQDGVFQLRDAFKSLEAPLELYTPVRTDDGNIRIGYELIPDQGYDLEDHEDICAICQALY